MDDGSRIRKQIRLAHYNYARAGFYYISICIHNRKEVLGKIVNGEFQPLPAGVEARASWEDLPAHHALIHLDEYIIMPNHLHAIVVLEWIPEGDAGVATTALRNDENHPDRSKPGPDKDSLGAIIGSYKAAVSRKLGWKKKHGYPLWQRSFFDHVIRTDEELHTIREYIANNPLSWQLDEFNASRTGRNSFYEWLAQKQ